MSDHDDDLTRALRRQARQLPETPLTLDVVRARAKRIQRGRRITVAVAAAAAVAIIAPAGLLLSDSSPKSDAPPVNRPTPTSTPSPTSPSTTPSTTPPATSATPGQVVPIDTSNVNAFRYAFPITYWSGPDGGIETTSGPVIPVTQRVSDAAQVGADQWIGMVSDGQGGYSYTSFDSDGELTREQTTGDRIAITPDGSSYAYLSLDAPDSSDPAVWTIREGGAFSGSWTLDETPPDGSGVRGILPDGTVVVELGEGQVFLADPGGDLVPWAGRAVKVRGVSSVTGRMTVVDSVSDFGSCSRVTDADNHELARTCGYTLDEFSPDGRYVIGFPAYFDGPGMSEVSILDAETLEPVVTFKAAREAIISSDVAWFGDNLVAQVWANGGWNLMGLFTEPQQSPGGTFQTGVFVGPIVAGYEESPWTFGAGPIDVPQR